MARDNDDAVKTLRVDIKKIKTALGAENKDFRNSVSKGISMAGLKVEEAATKLCPINTSQLSKTIGHFRVDPDTQEDAKLEYGKAAGPETAIWEKEKWNELVMGTAVDYAYFAHLKNPFLTNALAQQAPEILRIIEKTVFEELKKKFG